MGKRGLRTYKLRPKKWFRSLLLLLIARAAADVCDEEQPADLPVQVPRAPHPRSFPRVAVEERRQPRRGEHRAPFWGEPVRARAFVDPRVPVLGQPRPDERLARPVAVFVGRERPRPAVVSRRAVAFLVMEVWQSNARE